jgi:hypothetical protein
LFNLFREFPKKKAIAKLLEVKPKPMGHNCPFPWLWDLAALSNAGPLNQMLFPPPIQKPLPQQCPWGNGAQAAYVPSTRLPPQWRKEFPQEEALRIKPPQFQPMWPHVRKENHEIANFVEGRKNHRLTLLGVAHKAWDGLA